MRGKMSTFGRAGQNFNCNLRAISVTKSSDTPAMPLNEAHFGGFFCGCRPIVSSVLTQIHHKNIFSYTGYRFFLHLDQDMVENVVNKTPQAYPVVRYREAQTGGFLFFKQGGNA